MKRVFQALVLWALAFGLAPAQTSVLLAPVPIQQFNQGGIPCSGCKLFTYAAGTTTKLATYTDSTGVTPNTNPIILDSNGQASVWLANGSAYKLVLSPSYDTDPPTAPYWTSNQITGVVNANVTTGRLIGTQVFTASGTYVPTPGMGSVKVTLVGGGAGGAGIPATPAGQSAGGAGGGAGGIGVYMFTAAQIGTSQPIVIGAGGAGGNFTNGSNGGSTAFGSGGVLGQMGGGTGGLVCGPTGATTACGGSNGGALQGGSPIWSANGAAGGQTLIFGSTAVIAGFGGIGYQGGGGGTANNQGNGGAATGPGGGGGGAASGPGSGGQLGGAGHAGIAIFEEYSQ